MFDLGGNRATLQGPSAEGAEGRGRGGQTLKRTKGIS